MPAYTAYYKLDDWGDIAWQIVKRKKSKPDYKGRVKVIVTMCMVGDPTRTIDVDIRDIKKVTPKVVCVECGQLTQ